MSVNVKSPKDVQFTRPDGPNSEENNKVKPTYRTRQDTRQKQGNKSRQDNRKPFEGGNKRESNGTRGPSGAQEFKTARDNKSRNDKSRNDNKDSKNKQTNRKRTNGLESAEQKPFKRSKTKDTSANPPKSLFPQKLNEVLYLDEPPLQFLSQVGQGTYGKVYKVIDIQTQKALAMKGLRLQSNRDGFPVVAAREIKLLQMLKHRNIVDLSEVIISKSEIYMALEYIEHDLAGLLLNDNLAISQANAKSLVKQTLSALDYLHTRQILHRDLKGSNILVTNDGTVKLADFGLARRTNYSLPNVRYTNRVISLWYRPPELLLGAEHYGPEVDIWGAGCLLVEIFNRSPLFKATEEVSQMLAIYSVMGVPTPTEWPNHNQLPWYHLINSLPTPVPTPKYKLDRIFSGDSVTPACFELAAQLLQMNPSKRLDAASALKHSYFSEHPQERKLNLSMEDEWHDWEAKNRKRNDASALQ